MREKEARSARKCEERRNEEELENDENRRASVRREGSKIR